MFLSASNFFVPDVVSATYIELLGPYSRITGPAVIEHPTTNIVLNPGFDLACDSYCNFLIFRTSELKKYAPKVTEVRYNEA